MLRIALADIRELFEAPAYDPFNRQVDRDPGVERVLKLLEGKDARAATELQIALVGEAETVPSVEAVKAAIAAFCTYEVEEQRRLLKLTRRHGRQALWIGVPVLAICLGISTFATAQLGTTGFANLVSNSLIIAGWVAIWRPSELLLYDWWPYWHRITLLHRLARMTVRVVRD